MSETLVVVVCYAAVMIVRIIVDKKSKKRHADQEAKIIDLRDRINKVEEKVAPLIQLGRTKTN